MTTEQMATRIATRRVAAGASLDRPLYARPGGADAIDVTPPFPSMDS